MVQPCENQKGDCPLLHWVVPLVQKATFGSMMPGVLARVWCVRACVCVCMCVDVCGCELMGGGGYHLPPALYAIATTLKLAQTLSLGKQSRPTVPVYPHTHFSELIQPPPPPLNLNHQHQTHPYIGG
jgi:hypothetical protein